MLLLPSPLLSLLGRAELLLHSLARVVSKRVEVVAVAHVDERLAAVVHLLELPHDVVRRRERDVRAVADFGRTLRALRNVEDVFRRQAGAGDLLDRFVEPAAIVGHVNRQRRGTGGDDAEHVAFVDQFLRDLLEQFPDPRSVAEVQVQVVDEDQEDPPGGIVGRARRPAG